MKNRGMYFLGVAVGLTISWVTGGIAYAIAGTSVLPELVELELVVSLVCFIIAYLTRNAK
jgi:predicted branched-subunit amino acid permease